MNSGGYDEDREDGPFHYRSGGHREGAVRAEIVAPLRSPACRTHPAPTVQREVHARPRDVSRITADRRHMDCAAALLRY